MKLILWLTHFALVNQLDLFSFLYLYCYFCIQLYLHCCTNRWYTHTALSQYHYYPDTHIAHGRNVNFYILILKNDKTYLLSCVEKCHQKRPIWNSSPGLEIGDVMCSSLRQLLSDHQILSVGPLHCTNWDSTIKWSEAYWKLLTIKSSILTTFLNMGRYFLFIARSFQMSGTGEGKQCQLCLILPPKIYS